jgi:hypothetical protein
VVWQIPFSSRSKTGKIYLTLDWIRLFAVTAGPRVSRSVRADRANTVSAWFQAQSVRHRAILSNQKTRTKIFVGRWGVPVGLLGFLSGRKKLFGLGVRVHTSQITKGGDKKSFLSIYF